MRRPNTHVHKSLYNNKFAKKMSARSDCARLTATPQHLCFAYMGISNSTVLVNRILFTTGGGKQGESTIYVKTKNLTRVHRIRVYNLYRQPSGSKNQSNSIESLLEPKLFSLNQEGNNTPCMFSPILNQILVFKCILILKTIQNFLFENLFL